MRDRAGDALGIVAFAAREKQRFRHARSHMTRRDDVDTDGILRDLDRELPRKGEDRTFGGGVSGNPVATDQRRYRGHVDDRSPAGRSKDGQGRSEEHTSELQSLMRISYAVFCLKKKPKKNKHNT